MSKKFFLLTTIILSSSLYSDTTTLKNGKVYHNAKVFHKGNAVTVSFECGKQIVINKSEISETEIKPLTRWKTQEECNQTEEEAKQAAEKRKEEEAKRKEEKRLKEEKRQQELVQKKQAEEKRKQEEVATTGTITGTITLKNGKVYQNAKFFYKDKDVIAEFECGKRIVFKRSESQAEIKPLTRWKMQKECNQSEEASLKEEKGLQEEQRRQELVLKKQDCEDKGNIWNGRNCETKSVAPSNEEYKKESEEKISMRWSDDQGRMDWRTAIEKCISFGMRLPSISELKFAYTEGLTKSWGWDVYWSSDQNYSNAFTLNTFFFGIVNEYGDGANHRVRCIR